MYIRYFIYFFVVGFAILLIQKLSLVPSILLNTFLDYKSITIQLLKSLIITILGTPLIIYIIFKLHNEIGPHKTQDQDITELNKARIEQESIANELVQLIDTANAPIFGIDAKGMINEWNQQAEFITGFTKAEVMGQDLVGSFITDEYRKSVGEVLKRALKGEETANYEFPLFTKSGDRVDVLLNSTTRRDADGNVSGVIGVGQNITELNKVRIKQDSIATELVQLVDTANAPIFGIDAEGKINEWNQQAEFITGFTKEEAMGQDLVASFITDEYKESVGEVLQRALNGEETANYEFPLFTKTEDRVDVLLNSTTRRDAEGNVSGVIGVGQDITGLKLAQAQVIQTSKLASLGEMATSIAHEINQPLNTIRLAASNIKDRIHVNGFTQEYVLNKLKKIDDQVIRASSIINHLKMFGRNASEKPHALDPEVVMKSVIKLIGEQLRLDEIKLKINFDTNSFLVCGHQIQLEQVFLNIINNARYAIIENSKNSERNIFINGNLVKGNKFKISITDTGGGIPNNLIPHIFTPFITSKPMGKGTGLGLSVSYGIINEMNGNIYVKNVEQGSCFVVILPIYNF
jgi:PAS domain S-box-containing protein